MRTRVVLGLALFLALGPVSTAWAACTQANLQGTWQSYAGGVDGDGFPFWFRCKLVINASGAIAANKTCANNLGQSFLTSSGGRLTLSSACIVTGTVKIAGESSKVNHGTLDPGKNVVSGVGTDTDGGAFVFNAIRQ